MPTYETVIGLEVHTQLMTASKIFCSCSTQFGASPNTNTCPVCQGMPGVLPVLNHRVVELAVRTGLATNCRIAPQSVFARKNYFYPDLPKAYQISQYELPLAEHGWLEITVNGTIKKIGITRIHMEEDAGKLLHEYPGEAAGTFSYVDFNRCGVPLLEIVSEPDMRSPEEAKEYLLTLKNVLEYLEVSDCNMEEGSLRCDANISLRPVGSDTFGTKTEVKNMNSFRNVQRALEYEVERQTLLLEAGESIAQETRLWDADRGMTFSMRSKEEAHDYRYFPEPDLIPLTLTEAWIETIRQSLPELATAKRQRFITQYDLPEYDAEVLTSAKYLANYYEECVQRFPQPKIVSNWVMGDILRKLKQQEKDIRECPVSPAHLAQMLQLVEKKTISGKIAKTVFEDMYATGKMPTEIVQEKGLVQISDEGQITTIIDQILAENPDPVAQYRAGKTKTFGFFVGQVMKATQGKANPQLVNTLLKQRLKE
ncbi:Asp-tRNA(Asn)/Glu-tRNA(Gln) amidotransferase subunit GatB [candidate division KSB3 bacterium]|uniref:Aspartyl/glutamyl-tRNA(Asn/Gln) amidotransferase subunit B n=1 Tax=candidate division KSB3 bacterium TaxID=2044937 RepID=A0A9D5K0C9_9BACT|nr:Asp-tRNA(Asn)/Glu-tRNA(Gln) amidotransferase subunit GatB [candidate division KSB3 bacterium]MBD3327320.1 Asp-tRNA(Asn)/Glu-tRNA(Gln) amidotransferase subunit GatB [candidate division KSB3 bacterium]